MTTPYFNPEDTIQRTDLREKAGLFKGGLDLRNPPEAIGDSFSPELWNVKFTKRDSVRPRGLPVKKFDTPIDVKGAFSFVDANNVGWLVITDNVDVYISDDLFATSTKINGANTHNSAYKLRFAYMNGSLYGTNGVDPVFQYVISTSTFNMLDIAGGHSEDVPLGRHIATHNGMLILANTTANPNAIYYSRKSDETLFTHPVTTNTQVIFAHAEAGGIINGLKSFKERLIIPFQKSTFVLHGWDENEFRLENISENIGCGNAESIQEVIPDETSKQTAGVVWIGSDGNFYKTDTNDIWPIGDAIEEGLKGKVMQIFTYQEERGVIKKTGTYKFSDGTFGEYFSPDVDDVNNEPDFSHGYLYTDDDGQGLVRNGLFSDGLNKWTASNQWHNRVGPYITTFTNWHIDSGRAVTNTLHSDSKHLYGRANKIAIEVRSAHDDSLLSTIEYAANSSDTIFLPSINFLGVGGYLLDRQTYAINTSVSSSYTSWTGLTIAELEYKKVYFRLKVHRQILYYAAGTIINKGYGGYAYIDSDPFYCAGNQIKADFVIYSSDYKTDNIGVDKVYGAKTFNQDTADKYESAEIDLPTFSKWGVFDSKYTNNKTTGSVSYEYRIYNAGWGAWTSIDIGDLITGAVGASKKIQFRVWVDGVTDSYEAQDIMYVEYIAFEYFKTITDLPPTDSDICSLFYDGYYKCAMSVHEMGNFSGENNVNWILDEFNGVPRWSRWDLKIRAMVLYGNKPLYFEVDEGFILDEDKFVMNAGESFYDNLMGFMYKTKAFDFGVTEMLKWFKYFIIDVKAVKDNIDPDVLFEVHIDDKYAGSFYSEDMAGNSRIAKLNVYEEIFNEREPERHVEGTTDYETKVIGYGNRIQFYYLFCNGDSAIADFELNSYEILNTVLFWEVKDYAVLPIKKTTKKLRSSD